MSHELLSIESVIELTPRQRAAIDYRGSNVLVEAVPGSGKTRVIVERCAALLREGVLPSQILLLTFSRKAVGELQQRIAKVAKKNAQPEIRTFHGFASRLLSGAGRVGASSRLLSEPAERELFRHIVLHTPLPTISREVAEGAFFREAAAVLVDDLSRSAPSALERLQLKATPRLRDLLTLAQRQKDERRKIGVADFDDLVGRVVAEAEVPDSTMSEILRSRYKHVLVDEFQDTDPLQLALLEQFAAEIFAVGDESQSIYGFRGAARNAMKAAKVRLMMETLALDESFRCPREVCELAASVWPTPVPLKSALTDSAEIRYRRAASQHDEAALVAAEIAAAIERGLPENKIAVLLRSADPLADLIEGQLGERGIAYSRRGGQRILSDPATDAVCAALSALAEPANPDLWVRALGHPAFGLDPVSTRVQLHRKPPRSVSDACALLNALQSKESSPATHLANAFRAAEACWESREIVRAARAIASYSSLLAYVTSRDEDEARLSASRITTFLDALSDFVDLDAKLRTSGDAATLLRSFLENATNWRSGNERIEESGVAILTVHAAKGLEFAFVIVADAVETHFPQSWRPDPLVTEAEIDLARSYGVDLGTRRDEHDTEERSLWYVAVTRAQQSLLVTWSESDNQGTPLRPSRFIPLTARTLEAKINSFRGPLEFHVAEDLPDRQAPTAATLTREIRTSTMESWFSCRRSFYYKALLRISSNDGGFAPKLGTLVSAAVERFHQHERDFRAVDEGAHQAWTATLRGLAREIVDDPEFDGFGSSLETEAALRAADRLLNRYALSLENSARAEGGAFEVIGVEEPVRYSAHGIEFSGRIDRIDRRADGTLAIVDIKTGKIKAKGAMHEAYPRLAIGAAENTIWSKSLPGNPQLPLYRYSQTGTNVLEYLYLGTESKPGKFDNSATSDRLDIATQNTAIEAIDSVLSQTFFEPWQNGQITDVLPTSNARTCRRCEFVTVCSGFIEDDD